MSEAEGKANRISRILRRLGSPRHSKKARQDLRESLLRSRQDAEDELDQLKVDVSKAESKAVAKNAEMKDASGSVQRIVRREIELIFRDVDRMRGREEIVAGKLERLSSAIAKLDELSAGQEAVLEEDLFYELSLSLREMYSDLEGADLAREDMERQEYEAAIPAIDVDTRLAELVGQDVTVEDAGDSALEHDPVVEKKRSRKIEVEDE